MNERLKELYELALFKKLVSSKTEFANFIGMDNSSFSHALKNTGRVNAHNAIMRAEHALMQAGININESGVQVVNSTTGDVLGGNAQKKFNRKDGHRFTFRGNGSTARNVRTAHQPLTHYHRKNAVVICL